MEGRQLEMLTKKLNLTADQQTKVKAIDEDSWKADDGGAKRYVAVAG